MQLQTNPRITLQASIIYAAGELYQWNGIESKRCSFLPPTNGAENPMRIWRISVKHEILSWRTVGRTLSYDTKLSRIPLDKEKQN
uniref:Uncharacterized protein n=1 Tax=Vespula pensylvanica TaxID=30213 RepID=A0A834JWY3_VESPE|nr:hypothetical protein H0235_017019 [Vespula pensylvanica]